MMRFRHLDYSDEVAIGELGAAGLDDLLDRGDITQWAPLARAVRADPFGELAQLVLHLCESHQMYGTSVLWRSWVERLRSGRSHEPVKSLPELRRSRGLTQDAVGDHMGMSQSDVSKLEHRSDLRLSTLLSYVAATGGRLEIRARFFDGDTELDLRVPVRSRSFEAEMDRRALETMQRLGEEERLAGLEGW